jgi:phage recombination protein Bet
LNASAKKSTNVAVAEKQPEIASPVAAANASLMSRVASRFGVEPEKMNNALKQTAFRQRGKDGNPGVEVTNEQMLMLMVVADQYKLNPFTREIYAFPSENGIVAIVSVDGWIRIINERPELKSISFDMAPPGTEDPWISCTIERHDRSKAVTITEFLSECSRDTKPWNSHPRRMLRHKALIQCARVAFGFGGIFDPDEADRIVSVVDNTPQIQGKPKTQTPQMRIKQEDPGAEDAAIKLAPTISVDQQTAILDKVREEGVSLSLLLAAFEIGDIVDLPANQYGAAIAQIDQFSNGG